MRRTLLIALLLGCAASAGAQGRLAQDLTSTTCPGSGCLVQFAVNGQAGMAIQVSGTFVGTLVTEASVEGSVWVSWPVLLTNATDNTQAVTSMAGPGLWFGATSGLYQVRVRMSAYTSGTARVAVQLSTTAPGAWVLPPVVPPSSVLSDALPNPTTRTTGAYLLAWDATNSVWRRVQVDAATGWLKVTGVMTVKLGATALPSMVLATNLDTPLLAANTNRVAWRVCNQSRSPLLVKFGSGATEFSYNVRVAPRACYEDSSYTGQVNGFWYANADNFAMVSESF